jgi:glucose-1-phosphatase
MARRLHVCSVRLETRQWGVRSSESKRVLLCDLGGVLVRLSFDLAIESWASASGRDRTALRRGFCVDDEFAAFEAGRITTESYFDHLRGSLDLDLSDAEMESGWNAIYLGVDQDVLTLLDELRGAGVRVVGVTNTNPVHLAHWFPWYQRDFPVFDELYISTHMQCRKPERRFFEVVIQGEEIVEDDLVIFVDDSEQNVLGAHRSGIEGFVFHDPDQMHMELRERRLLP